jgi:putative IMPACT (imprinted ancient) family translation regulator
LSTLSSTPITYTIKEYFEKEEIIKKSKFLVKLIPIKNSKDAAKFINKYSDIKANHNCWAFRLNDIVNDDEISLNKDNKSISIISRSSDDGEVKGTAGLPILSALESENIFDVLILITRHFGGIKLGTGGLIRAYGGSARSSLRLANKVPIIACKIVKIDGIMMDLDSIYKGFASTNGFIEKLNEKYDVNGDSTFEMSIKIDEIEVINLQNKLTNLCKGRVNFTIL